MIPTLLFDIAKCDNFFRLIPTALRHPCNEIVDFQRQHGAIFLSDFQLPEPWSGDILKSPILFISSNPAYSSKELFPTPSWPDQMIADFFINRFVDRGPYYSWVYRNKVLNRDGTRSRSVRYWASIKNRAGELLGRNAIPGSDYCLTELVHCKSTGEIGVAGALPECTRNYLTRKISICGAKLIVSVGSHVRNYFGGRPNITGIPIIYLPAPSSFGPHTIAGNFTEEEVNSLKEELSLEHNINVNVELSDIQLPTEIEVRNFLEEQLKLSAY